MIDSDIEKAVFDLVEEYNGISLLTFTRFALKKDLNKDFRMAPEDAAGPIGTVATKNTPFPCEMFDYFINKIRFINTLICC